MKALLDTNIIIHREASRIVNRDIGNLFRWLDKAKYIKCVHPLTVAEIQKHLSSEIVKTMSTKLESYEILKTIAPLNNEVGKVCSQCDTTENDKNDTLLINEVYCGRADILVTEDKKIHAKALALKITDKVFSIDSLLEKIVAEHPELIDYKVLAIKKKHFGEIDLADPFFDSFKQDYKGFDKWFNGKADSDAYVTSVQGKILSFLYLKIEEAGSDYSDITPPFPRKKRLKIGTFKVVSNGVRLGERFMKIVFDNAITNKVDEIYLTIFDNSDEQKRLIDLIEDWGFVCHGTKTSSSGIEKVYRRDFTPSYNDSAPKLTYPYVSGNARVFLTPIYPDYHTELLPDSILKTESPENYQASLPHRNAISKVYISRSLEKGIKCGDVMMFYRTGGYYKSVVTTIGIIDNVIFDINNVDDFILKCRKRSIFTNSELKKHWDYMPRLRPYIVNFLYVYSFPNRINLKRMIELGIIKDIGSAPRGFQQISTKHFETILKETKSDESIIVH